MLTEVLHLHSCFTESGVPSSPWRMKQGHILLQARFWLKNFEGFLVVSQTSISKSLFSVLNWKVGMNPDAVVLLLTD